MAWWQLLCILVKSHYAPLCEIGVTQFLSPRKKIVSVFTGFSRNSEKSFRDFFFQSKPGQFYVSTGCYSVLVFSKLRYKIEIKFFLLKKWSYFQENLMTFWYLGQLLQTTKQKISKFIYKFGVYAKKYF